MKKKKKKKQQVDKANSYRQLSDLWGSTLTGVERAGERARVKCEFKQTVCEKRERERGRGQRVGQYKLQPGPEGRREGQGREERRGKERARENRAQFRFIQPQTTDRESIWGPISLAVARQLLLKVHTLTDKLVARNICTSFNHTSVEWRVAHSVMSDRSLGDSVSVPVDGCNCSLSSGRVKGSTRTEQSMAGRRDRETNTWSPLDRQLNVHNNCHSIGLKGWVNWMKLKQLVVLTYLDDVEREERREKAGEYNSGRWWERQRESVGWTERTRMRETGSGCDFIQRTGLGV